MQLEMKLIQGNDAGFWWAERAAGGSYFVSNGGGMTDPMQVSYPDYVWTGRYRAVCAN